MPCTRKTEPFYFGVPLISRAASGDWRRIDVLLAQTLGSVLAQTDGNFRLLLAAHELPPCWERLVGSDARFEHLRAGWSPESPTRRNDDAGMKKAMIKARIEQAGGGLLMYLDADDLVDRRLVATARSRMGPEVTAAIVAAGVAINQSSGRAVVLPHAKVFDLAFHQVCGSSTVARVSHEGLDPYAALGSHHEWGERARERGMPLDRLPVWGGYLVGTSENHSELHGPYAGWRAQFNAAVTRHGRELHPRLSHLLGIS